ncbi:hypothetical protein CFP56_012751 [Quercus suber]|uniref:Uncharacterized protein n=1 Tax=Quercus suber TaxID=58331 RepID=A0AAW0KY00_QUESU
MDYYLFGLLQYQMLNVNKVSDGFMVKAWIEMNKFSHNNESYFEVVGEDVDQLFANSHSHVAQKNLIGPAYKALALTWMIALFSKQFRLLCGKEVLEDYYLSLMKEYTYIKDHLK